MEKRIISIVLSMHIILIPCFTYANAELDAPTGEKIMEAYSYTSTVSTTLSINDTGVAKPRAVITGLPGTSTKLHVTMHLQKYSNGTWKTVQSWSSSTASNSLTLSKSKNVSHGKYRTHTVFKAYHNSSSETITKNSGIVTDYI